MSAQDTHVTVPNGHRMRARWFLPEQPNGLNAAVVVIHDIFGFSSTPAGNGCWNKPISRSPRWP